MSDLILPGLPGGDRRAAMSRQSERTLPENEGALVTINRMEGLNLLLPTGSREDALPPTVEFLAACALRAATDGRFVTEMLQWFRSNRPRGH